jgi:hypothetical protein
MWHYGRKGSNLTEGEDILAIALPILVYSRLENIHGREIVDEVMGKMPMGIRPERHRRWEMSAHFEMVGARGRDVALKSYARVASTHENRSAALYALLKACRFDEGVVVDALTIAHRFLAREAGELAQVEAFRDYYVHEQGGDISNLF